MDYSESVYNSGLTYIMQCASEMYGKRKALYYTDPYVWLRNIRALFSVSSSLSLPSVAPLVSFYITSPLLFFYIRVEM